MIPLPPRILLAAEPVDFRNSINGLAAIASVVLQEKPLSGQMFVFTNKRRDGIKCLVWSHGGFILLYKRLEKARFRVPQPEGDRLVLTAGQLAALLEGIDLTKARRILAWNADNSP
jgi:transposase